jgi:hypothetical protein
MLLAVVNSGVGSMPSPASWLASGTTSVAREAEQQLAQLPPDPVAARILFQAVGGLVVQGPDVLPGELTVSLRGRLGLTSRQGQADDGPVGHRGLLGPGGPGGWPQIDEGLLVVRPCSIRQCDLGLLMLVHRSAGR